MCGSRVFGLSFVPQRSFTLCWLKQTHQSAARLFMLLNPLAGSPTQNTHTAVKQPHCDTDKYSDCHSHHFDHVSSLVLFPSPAAVHQTVQATSMILYCVLLSTPLSANHNWKFFVASEVACLKLRARPGCQTHQIFSLSFSSIQQFYIFSVLNL